MVVTTGYEDIALAGSPMRTFVAAPKAEGEYPGIWCYSDIFQLTPPMLRTCVRLAGYGFVAAAPEIYRRIEPPGTVIAFDQAGRKRRLEDAAKNAVARFRCRRRGGRRLTRRCARVGRGIGRCFTQRSMRLREMRDRGLIRRRRIRRLGR